MKRHVQFTKPEIKRAIQAFQECGIVPQITINNAGEANIFPFIANAEKPKAKKQLKELVSL